MYYVCHKKLPRFSFFNSLADSQSKFRKSWKVGGRKSHAFSPTGFKIRPCIGVLVSTFSKRYAEKVPDQLHSFFHETQLKF